MVRRQRHAPSLDRRRASREPKRRFIIFCEGKNTEPDYFKALKRLLKGALIEIEAVGVGGVPKTIASRAIEKAESIGVRRRKKKGRSSFEERDEVWAVFDRDNHPEYYESIQRCESAGVGVGRSNPCFELWLILHMEKYDRPDGRRAVQNHLREVCPEYDPKKRKMANCIALVKSLGQAEDRAEMLIKRRGEEQDGSQLGPPYTTVQRLTRAIREAAAEFHRLPQ